MWFIIFVNKKFIALFFLSKSNENITEKYIMAKLIMTNADKLWYFATILWYKAKLIESAKLGMLKY